MKVRKIPERTCVISHEKLPKSELIRIVRTPEGQILIDKSGKMNGRGAYLKKDLEIINKAKKGDILNKKLECNVPKEIYDELISLL